MRDLGALPMSCSPVTATSRAVGPHSSRRFKGVFHTPLNEVVLISTRQPQCTLMTSHGDDAPVSVPSVNIGPFTRLVLDHRNLLRSSPPRSSSLRRPQ